MVIFCWKKVTKFLKMLQENENGNVHFNIKVWTKLPNFAPDLIAVSYTHLDVYKRQHTHTHTHTHTRIMHSNILCTHNFNSNISQSTQKTTILLVLV